MLTNSTNLLTLWVKNVISELLPNDLGVGMS